jgi:ATP-dependent DNA helicase RecG
VPIYSETEGLHQKYLRKIMHQALENYARYVVSPIPADICEKRDLPNIQESLRSVHFPENNKDLEEYNSNRSLSHRRLIYDEFFFFQLVMAIKKTGRILDAGIKFNIEGILLNKFYALLPFDLTMAQKRVINEIQADLAKETSMNRLLQGDVGSGKTIVSMAAMVTACENSYQAAIMAPTDSIIRIFRIGQPRWG